MLIDDTKGALAALRTEMQEDKRIKSEADLNVGQNSLKAYRDIKNSIETAKEEGEMKGIAKEKIATAKRLLAMGLTPEQAAKGAELPIEEINKII